MNQCRVSRKGSGVVFGQAAFPMVDRCPKTTPDPVAYHPIETRRQWFASLGRWCALAGLAVLTARLGLRSGQAADCGRRLPCQQCGLLERCALPRAVKRRQEDTRS